MLFCLYSIIAFCIFFINTAVKFIIFGCGSKQIKNSNQSLTYTYVWLHLYNSPLHPLKFIKNKIFLMVKVKF